MKFPRWTKKAVGFKKDIKLRVRVNKEGVYTYILIKNSHPVLQLDAMPSPFTIPIKPKTN